MEKDDIYVVGIGASAGGTEAIFDLFALLPEIPRTAYVIIRHVSPHHASEFPRFLEKHTKLKVKNIENGENVVPGTVYVLPPNCKAKIKNRKFSLRKRPTEEKINNAINDFFYSLADDLKENAIGIILSGFLSDGAKGSKYINEKGGLVIIQSPETARIKEMPQEAININPPDKILNIAEMPSVLKSYIEESKLAK